MPTRATRLIVLGIMTGMVFGAGATLPAEAAASCEALVGKWKWFTGGVVSINPDGTIAHDPGNEGTWECTDPARGRATLRWRLGGWVNRVALSADGRTLASTDPSQSYVTAQRIGTPRTVEAPAPPKPAEPSRRADAGPPSKPSQTAKAAEPKAADQKPVDPKAAGPTTPAPRAPESKTVSPPTGAKKSEAPPPTGPSSPPLAKSGQAGPCSGKACTAVRVETADRCVWLRNSASGVVLVEIRLAGETLKMTLDKPDMVKVVKEPDRTPNPRPARQVSAKKRLEEIRRKGADIPAPPKVEGPSIPTPTPAPTADRSRAWHGTMYDPLSNTDRPVFHARIDRAGGCVTDPGEILGYRARLASAPVEEDRAIPCTGEACADVDASPEQTDICRLANRGGREIAVGIAQVPNRDVSIQLTLRPNGTVKLDFFAGCLKAGEIGRIEARYK